HSGCERSPQWTQDRPPGPLRHDAHLAELEPDKHNGEQAEKTDSVVHLPTIDAISLRSHTFGAYQARIADCSCVRPTARGRSDSIPPSTYRKPSWKPPCSALTIPYHAAANTIRPR